MYRLVLAAIVLLFSFVGAEAKTRHHHHHRIVQQQISACDNLDVMNPCKGWFNFFQQPNAPKSTQRALIVPQEHRRSRHKPRNEQTGPVNYYNNPSSSRTVSSSARIVEHPAGCPYRAFCGCGASVEIFGHPVRDLYLARNWFKFPVAMPAPNTVAVRRHHVFVLKQHVEGDRWIVFDANSGHHLTRVHERSIAGYTIVRPM